MISYFSYSIENQTNFKMNYKSETKSRQSYDEVIMKLVRLGESGWS